MPRRPGTRRFHFAKKKPGTFVPGLSRQLYAGDQCPIQLNLKTSEVVTVCT
jgi:hypothetical protein